MSAALEYDAMVRELCAIGVPRDKAEQQAKRELRIVVETSPVATQAASTLALPFRLSIPWSMLVSDNDKFQAGIRQSVSGKHRPMMLLSLRYKTGKAGIRELAQQAVGDASPLAVPLVFVGHVYRPSQHRNDATNFSKIVHDALSGVVYDDDSRLFRVTWIKVAEPCVDRPRAEIEISKL